MRTALAILVAAPCALLAAPARPCSLAPPTLSGPIAPADDATDVPLNAVVHLWLQSGVVDFAATLSREDAEDASLPVTRDDDLAVVDLGDLAAGVDYTVTFDLAGTSVDFGEGRDPLRFRTGDARDDDAPTITSAPTATVRHRPGDAPFGPVSSCGPSSATNSIVVGPLDADDDVAVAGWRMFRLDERGGRAQVAAEVVPRTDGLVAFEPEAGTYRYGVVAFDLAGNESDMVEVEAWASGVGCSATSTSSTGAPASLALVAVAAAALRRRNTAAPAVR
jgi:uncharacterized protein (TIGR03382 family)